MSRPLAVERPSFGLGWALAVSVLLHLVLVLLGWLFPFRPGIPERPTPDESTLRFTFAPVTDADVASRPAGDVPIPAPQPTPPQPSGARALVPVPPTPPPVPAEARELPEPEESVPEERPTAPEAERGVSMPPGGDEPVGRRASTRAGPARGFDAERALRDFRRALRSPAKPPGESDGQDRQEGINVPDLPPLPSTGFGFGNLVFESRDYDWTDYARQIYVAIWRAWHNRLYATTDVFERWGHENGKWLLEHQSGIHFTIQRNGEVTDIAVVTASGCFPLDDSAVDALTEVILPPLPEDFPRDQESIHALFVALGDIRTMRRSLGYLKQIGAF